MDRFVEVAGKQIHVYACGDGAVTVVFLSGSGVPIPQLEYGRFQNALTDACRVIGIEKPGYGRSDLTEEDRSIDMIVDEYRQVLLSCGVTGPVVLAAHSMGFLEAVRWGQRCPAQVIGILGIDPATPECYSEFDLEKAMSGLVALSKDEQGKRVAAHAYAGQLVKEGLISADETEAYEVLIYRNLANHSWISEAENLKDALGLIEKDGAYLQIPMLFFLSNGEGTTIPKDRWFELNRNYLHRIEHSQYMVFDYPHNLYQYVFREMAERSKEFIENL